MPTSRGSRVEPNTGYVKRCGKNSWKIIALHACNNASYGAVADEALIMYKYAFANQFDVVCGDGNQHMQFHSPMHKKIIVSLMGTNKCSDIANGIFNLLARACVAQQNRGMPFARRVNMHSLDSNIFSDDPCPEDVDCMFTQIFEWGKTDSAQESRSTAEANIVQTAQKYARNFHSVDKVLKDHGSYMTWADYEYLSQHQESAHPMIAPLDYSIRVSERVLHLERAHFFLGSSDTDYHCPLLVTLREATIKNWRQKVSHRMGKCR